MTQHECLVPEGPRDTCQLATAVLRGRVGRSCSGASALLLPCSQEGSASFQDAGRRSRATAAPGGGGSALEDSQMHSGPPSEACAVTPPNPTPYKGAPWMDSGVWALCFQPLAQQTLCSHEVCRTLQLQSGAQPATSLQCGAHAHCDGKGGGPQGQQGW